MVSREMEEERGRNLKSSEKGRMCFGEKWTVLGKQNASPTNDRNEDDKLMTGKKERRSRSREYFDGHLHLRQERNAVLLTRMERSGK